MEDRIKAMFFDVGRTLIDYNNTSACERLACLSGKSVTVVRQLLYGTAEDEGLYTPESLIYPFDAGAVGIRRFIKTVRQNLVIPSNVPNACVRASFLNYFSLREGMEPLVKFLSKQFVVGITSNINRLQWEHWCETFPVLSSEGGVFSFYVLSFREKLMKPDLRFFEIALARASELHERRSSKRLLPEECLVFDDREENIRAAKELGLHGILVDETGYRGVVRELRRYYSAVYSEILESA